jgi:hypothetical protein
MSNPAQSEMILKGNSDPTELTQENAGGYAMLHLAMLQMTQSVDYLYRSGSMDRELWEAEMNRMAGVISTPGVRQLWDAGIKTQLAPSFVQRLESTRSQIAYVNWDSARGYFHDEETSPKGEPHIRS